MKSIDVLNLEWDAELSRDRQMATLVCNYLRFQGFRVVEGSIFNGYELIRKYHPKILFMTNAIGAIINVNIVKYACWYGIKVFTLVSEGNFREEELEQFLWGWNGEKILKESLNMQWSERTRLMTLKYYPDLKSKVKVSGAVGFDVYQILPFIDRINFLKKYQRNNYTKVIGVGCWDFGPFYPEDTRYNGVVGQYTSEEIAYFKKDGILFNEILEKIVLSNPQILFLLKEHPGCQLGYKGSAIDGVKHYPNILILKREEPIINCMAVSDFWMTYESTTALEAWLMNKQTCLLNPQGGGFKRDKIADGSPIYCTYEEIQKNIDRFYDGEILTGFEEKGNIRRKLVKDTIQWCDGFNHVRAGNELINCLENKEYNENYRISCLDRIYLKNFLIWRLCNFSFLIENWKTYKKLKNRFSKKQIEQVDELFYKHQVEFYESKEEDKTTLRKYICL